jgi:tyrosyl-tRNA synthetase
MSSRSIQREIERQLEVMREGAVELYGEDDLRARLADALGRKRPLRVKLGMDPSAPDLHLGHTVVLRKLERMQGLGHTPIFLVGDFTAMIGDPSGRKKTRPALDVDQVRKNAATYVEQVRAILDVEGAEVRFNNEWMREMAAEDMIKLCSRYTVARLLERDDFARRYKAGEAISVHEFLYPFVQAYDSVALEADVELGGTDQTFNLLMAREIQRDYGQPPQAVITHPLLVGLDGAEKMSKSLGNTIGITDPPEEIYGKVMSLSDGLMRDYYRHLAVGAPEVVQAPWLDPERGEPFGVKQQLAACLVARFHGREAALAAADHFQRVIQRKEVPEEVPEQRVAAGPDGAGLLRVMVQAGLASSNSEARRLVSQGAVELDGERQGDPARQLAPGPYLLKVGKRRFSRVRIE